jgi:hypothetical protein
MKEPARTYNQNHIRRAPSPDRRRASIYVSWSYPAEAGRNPAELDNRFSTMTEVRRVLWPLYEEPRFSDPMRFQQGIAGSLELFFWAWVPFQTLVGEVTGYPVPVFQRIDQAGFQLPLDERVLDDVDVLFLFGLDHNITGQAAEPEEIEAVRQFLKRPGTTLLIGPHHDVGADLDLEVRKMEYAHHGDPLVPRQQRFGLYTRTLMEGLGIPIVARYGCRPARDAASGKIAPLAIARDLDTKGWLEGVENFNLHMHLPHYSVTPGSATLAHVLARQPIDLDRPHPLSEAGEREFNSFVWIPPAGERIGDVLIADSTIFSTLFGGDASLERFWTNLVTVR